MASTAFISSQFWRLQVQDHGVHRVSPFRRFSHEPVYDRLLLGLHMALLLHMSVSASPLLIRTPVVCIWAHPNDLILTDSLL